VRSGGFSEAAADITEPVRRGSLESGIVICMGIAEIGVVVLSIMWST
jgi:hypothetical protein